MKNKKKKHTPTAFSVSHGPKVFAVKKSGLYSVDTYLWSHVTFSSLLQDVSFLREVVGFFNVDAILG